MSTFHASYYTEDGYVIGDRPLHVTFDENDLEYDMTEEHLEGLFFDTIQKDFEQRVIPVSDDFENFKKWAKNRIKELKESGEFD